jgi:hypothetical protein
VTSLVDIFNRICGKENIRRSAAVFTHSNMSSTPEIEVKEHPNFRTINVGGIYTARMGMHFEVTVYSEHLDEMKALAATQPNIPVKLNRAVECRLIIDPFHTKIIAQWLMGQVNAYEQQFGPIPSAEDMVQKGANTQPENQTNPAIG